MRTYSHSESPGSSVEKAAHLLFHLHERGEPLGVTSLGHALDLPKSSAHRLARSLVRSGLLEQDERGRYRPGFALVALGLGVLEGDPVVLAARPELEAEAAELGETVFLTAVRRRRIAVLDKAEGSGFLRAAPQVGATVPTHATAVGKLYLAFGAEQLDPPAGLEAFTAQTPTGRADLERAVATARANGWALSREEWIPGLSVVAAPVRPGGRMMAALAFASTTPRLDELGLTRVTHRIAAAASRVEERLAGVRG